MNRTQREELEQSRCTRIAPCATQHRSGATLPTAPCNRPRIGLFAQGGIERDGAWQGDDGLDVYSQEPIGVDTVLSHLLSHERVIASPHLGASTAKAQVRVGTEVTRHIIATLRGETLYGVTMLQFPPAMPA
jgi:hypothetical protein